MPAHRKPSSGPSAMDMICQLNKPKPSKFEARENPLRYEEWMRKLEKLFEIMDCPARFKMALATYQFANLQMHGDSIH